MKLQGIIPPVVTPLLGQDKLDLKGLERILDNMINGGVSGVFLLGTTGEAPSLSYQVRRDFVVESTRIVAGRVPILVSISDTSFTETIQFARQMEMLPISAFVLTTPYYYPAWGPQIRQYIDKVTKAVSLPIVLYNMPANTKVKLELETVQFAIDHPKIIALKESSGDLDYYWRSVELARGQKDFSVLIGPEHLLGASVRLGGNGGVNGGANLYPELFVNMYKAAKSNKTAEMEKLQKKIDLLGRIYRIPDFGLGVTRGLKAAMEIRGLCSALPAQPFTKISSSEQKKIAAVVEELFSD